MLQVVACLLRSGTQLPADKINGTQFGGKCQENSTVYFVHREPRFAHVIAPRSDNEIMSGGRNQYISAEVIQPIDTLSWHMNERQTRP